MEGRMGTSVALAQEQSWGGAWWQAARLGRRGAQARWHRCDLCGTHVQVTEGGAGYVI